MKLPFQTDPARGAAAVLARLGLVVLQTDEVIEGEFPRLLGADFGTDGIRLHVTRVPSGREVTPETLAAMEAELPAAVSLLPTGVPFDVIAYACTSGATVIGEAGVATAIRSVRPGVAVSNPLTAAKAALAALGLRRIGFVTPYTAKVSAAMRDKLSAAGFDTVSFGSFEVAEDGIVARMTPASILEAILSVGEAAPCDGIFTACTNLRAAGVIEEAEARLGKPVVTSNQALAWHMLRLAGYDNALHGHGQLFTRPLSELSAAAGVSPGYADAPR
ncbi:MAG: aspartate/glutamate racemase family protein [Kiloniellaceae bacterium]